MSYQDEHMDTVCFGGEDWWYHNRGHIDFQLMRRFAKKGSTLYINSIVMQKPKLKQGKRFIVKLVRKTKSIIKGLQKSDGGFWVYSPLSLPVHHISWLRHINKIILQFQLRLVTHKLGIRNPIVWVACPAACDIAVKMTKKKLVYQRTDVYELYPNIDEKTIRRYDRRLKADADLTIFVNRKLYSEEANQCRRALYLDHGVDYDMFASAEKTDNIPEDIAGIPKPIVGYFGSINANNTTDVQLIEKVTDLSPNVSIVLVGKLESDCSSLVARQNVWYLGQKPYEQIPHYGKCFDVAIMPWKQNRWIEACNPIKLKEYLALGKPIVSTPFAELQKYRDVIYEATTPEEFADCIKKALVEDNPERVAARRSKVKDASWESKAEQVMNELFGNLCDN